MSDLRTASGLEASGLFTHALARPVTKSMIAAFMILTSLIVLIPALRLLDGPLATGVLAASAAAAIFSIAFTPHAANLNRLSKLLRPSTLVALLPCIWMLLQVLPAPARSLANPVWSSAAVALNMPFFGAVSLDIGATLLCLVRYCAILAISLGAAATALDRHRAECLLCLVAAIAGLTSAQFIGFDLGYLGPAGFEYAAERADVLNMAVIGFILSCTIAIHVYESFFSRTKQQMSRFAASAAGFVSIISFLTCLYAILSDGEIVLLLSALLGTGLIVGVAAIRHWHLGPWGRAGTAALGVVAVFGFFALVPARQDMDTTLVWSTQTKMSSIERMLSDGNWTGSGAGSLDALLPIYLGIDEMASHGAPTTAATIAIEMGRPFLLSCIAIMLVGASLFFRQSLLRGRDYVYPAAGAGCIVGLSILLFANGGGLGVATSLSFGVICGVAFSQGRSPREKDAMQSERSGATSGANNISGAGLPLPPERRGSLWMRGGLIALGILLTTQAGWILLAERFPRRPLELPDRQEVATVERAERHEIKRAAFYGIVRGDLWAESAFTYAHRLWADPALELDASARRNNDVLNALSYALRYAPHRGDAWLMFAALTDRYKCDGYQPAPLLKMSYYTAPNQLALFPLRLATSLHSMEAIADLELQDMVGREISLVLTRFNYLKPALLTAYRSASPQGKAFAERVIAEIDPKYLSVVRARYP